jgi:hypothetical protein
VEDGESRLRGVREQDAALDRIEGASEIFPVGDVAQLREVVWRGG